MNRYLIRYKRYGLLRYLSNHENMRMIERLLRRTAVSFKMTEGFHERMRMSFGQALPTGVIDRAGTFVISTEENLDEEFLRIANILAPKSFEMSAIKKVSEDFNIGTAIEGYFFSLIFRERPDLDENWKLKENGKLWIARNFVKFNSPSPRPKDHGQFLTLRDEIVWR